MLEDVAEVRSCKRERWRKENGDNNAMRKEGERSGG